MRASDYKAVSLAEGCKAQLDRLHRIFQEIEQTSEVSHRLVKASAEVEQQFRRHEDAHCQPQAPEGLPGNLLIWLDARSCEARAFAGKATDHTIRQDMLRLADNYDKIAREAPPRIRREKTI